MVLQQVDTHQLTFESVTISALGSADIDVYLFGVVEMDHEGRVVRYNRAESELSGLDAARVLGRHFFSEVAPCMNNYMVAQKIEGATELDEIIDYVLTLRIAPTAVRMRLLKTAESSRQYLLVQKS